jgi:integrase
MLEWTAFKWDQGIIKIEPTKFLDVKTEGSIGDIEVDPELLEVFRELKTLKPNNFVLTSPSNAQPKPGVLYRYYRCNSLFKRFLRWLRSKGVPGTKPLHDLRKEFGSQLNDKHGIYVASRMLRHATIEPTAAHYLEKKSKKTVGLGSLLKSETVFNLPAEQKIVEGSF